MHYYTSVGCLELQLQTLKTTSYKDTDTSGRYHKSVVIIGELVVEYYRTDKPKS